MCPKPARPATAALAVLVAALAFAGAASPAYALFGSGKPKAAAQSAAPAAAPAADPATLRPRKATPEERAAAERMDPLARAAFWAREEQVDPNDVEAGVRLSAALRALGRYDEATQAADTVLVGAPNNLEAQLEDARARIGTGQGFYAIEVLKRAQALAPKDWRAFSLMGVALEQSERPEEAKAAYDQALALSPNNPAVLSNLAMMYAARGDSALAESLLRRAVSQPSAAAPERQNLALVLGLQGKLAEAERLLRQDLPPDVANANLAWLRANPGATASAASGGSRNWNALEGAQVIK